MPEQQHHAPDLLEYAMPNFPAAEPESLEALRARVGLSTSVTWMIVSGLSGIAGREHGETVLNDVWRRLMTSEQTTRSTNTRMSWNRPRRREE